MTDHVIECRWESHRCICEELRACEQRVFQEQIKGRQHDMVMAYLRGLDAAREAVAAMPPMEGWKTRPVGRVDLVDKWSALAAIDALKKNNET